MWSELAAALSLHACVQAEGKVMAERKGKGLNLSIKQLNAVLRL